MHTVTAIDVDSAWRLAEGFLDAGHIEAAICTLHGLLMAHAPFPLSLFETEVLTRLRLAHCFIFLTSNPDAAKKTLEDLLPRFEGYTAPAVHLFSASSALSQFRKQQQKKQTAASAATAAPAGASSKSGKEVLAAEEAMITFADQSIFVRKFPFALHVLKCHVFRLLGEAWLRKSAASSSGSSGVQVNRKLIANALQCFRDASVVVGAVLHRTKDWLGMNGSNSSSSGGAVEEATSISRRRQRESGGEGATATNTQQQEGAEADEQQKQQMTMCVWSAAALRLGSLQLSLRGAEAKAIHGLACAAFAVAGTASATGVPSAGGTSTLRASDGVSVNASALEYSQELVEVTSSALRDFFSTVGARNNGGSSAGCAPLPKEHMLLGSLFARFDGRAAATPPAAADDDKAEIEMATKINPDALLTPTLASVALLHVVGLLFCAPSSAALRARVVAMLELWGRAAASSCSLQQQQQQQKGAAFDTFSILWRFLLLLAQPDLATPQDLQLLQALGSSPSDGNQQQQQQQQGFQAPPPVLSANNKKKTATATSSKKRQQNENAAAAAAAASAEEEADGDDALKEWLGDSVIEPGTVYCASKLISLIHFISRHSSSPMMENNGDSSDAVNRGEDALQMLNEMMFFVEDQLRKLTAPTATATSTRNSSQYQVGSAEQQKEQSTFLTAKMYGEVKFLVAIKVCGYAEMALFDLVMQQDICSSISKLDTLRRYVVLFRQHTAHYRGVLHLLIAMLALYLGNRGAMQAHCEAAQECETDRFGNVILFDADDDEEEEEDGDGGRGGGSSGARRSTATVNAALSWTPTRDASLVEAVATYSLIRAAAAASSSSAGASNSKSSTTERIKLRKRFDELVAAAMSSIRDAEEIVQQEQSDESAAPAGSFLSTADNKILLWKLLEAARCIEDRDGAQALTVLHNVLAEANKVQQQQQQQQQQQSGTVNDNNNCKTAAAPPAGISVPTQYILATARRLEGVALYMTPDLQRDNAKASRASIQASFAAAAAIEEEGCIVHCLAWTLSTIVAVTTERERERQGEIFRKVSKTSEEYAAQVQLMLTGQIASTVDGLMKFLPGQKEYESWIVDC